MAYEAFGEQCWHKACIFIMQLVYPFSLLFILYFIADTFLYSQTLLTSIFTALIGFLNSDLLNFEQKFKHNTCFCYWKWQEKERLVVPADPEYRKQAQCHAWRVCQLCKNLWELCTDPCSVGLSMIMLQHKLMVVDEKHKICLPIP